MARPVEGVGRCMAQSLAGLAVLVVEDEFLLAADLAAALAEAGAKIVGPCGRVEEAIRLLTADAPVDMAVLDIDLFGHRVFPVADMLRAREVPFVFATGYDQDVIPERFGDAKRLEKPVSSAALVALLGGLKRPC